jgi:hypothetical protein
VTEWVRSEEPEGVDGVEIEMKVMFPSTPGSSPIILVLILSSRHQDGKTDLGTVPSLFLSVPRSIFPWVSGEENVGTEIMAMRRVFHSLESTRCKLCHGGMKCGCGRNITYISMDLAVGTLASWGNPSRDFLD